MGISFRNNFLCLWWGNWKNGDFKI